MARDVPILGIARMDRPTHMALGAWPSCSTKAASRPFRTLAAMVSSLSFAKEFGVSRDV